MSKFLAVLLVWLNRTVRILHGFRISVRNLFYPSFSASNNQLRCMFDGFCDGQPAPGTAYGNGAIRLWRIGTDEQVQIFHGHDCAGRAIAISPDGQTLVSASSDRIIKLWNLKTGVLLRAIALDAMQNGHPPG